MHYAGTHALRACSGLKRRGVFWGPGSLATMAGLSLVVATACGVTPAVGTGPAPQPQPAPAAVTVQVAASAATQEAKFFCYVETLSADRPSVYGYIAPRGCVPSWSFKRQERIVWRFEVLDVATGKVVTDVEAATVKLRLPYGVEEKADFKQRGEGRVADAPWTWDVCWDVPPDYPLGVLDYSIVVTLKDGRTGTWRPPAFVDPGRGIDTRPQVIE